MAFSFTGSASSDRIGDGIANTIGGQSAWTLSCWARLSTTASSDARAVFSNWRNSDIPATAAGNGSILCRVNTASDAIQCYIYTSVAQYGGAINKTISDTNWHHICATWDGSTLTGYLDAAAGSTTYSTTGTFGSHSFTQYIGNDYSANEAISRGSWEGDLAEFVFYDTDLSTDQISALAAGCSPLLVAPANLASYVPLFESAGSDTHDMIAPTADWNIAGSLVDAGHPDILVPTQTGIIL